MIFKKVLTGGADVQYRRYKKVIDWDAVFGIAFVGLVIAVVLFG